MNKITNELFSGREEFKGGILNKSDLDKNPFNQFKIWYKTVIEAGVKEANAMVVCSVSENGIPSSRIVYLRDVNTKGFVFFTNYDSTKGKNYQNNKYAAINFFWSDLHRQVNIIGEISQLSALDSDNYFNSRPRSSQIGAWASKQSEEISGRSFLEEQVAFYEKKFSGVDIPRPPHWGGYCIEPIEIEFWQGRESRLHDRFKYVLENNLWKIKRLSP